MNRVSLQSKDCIICRHSFLIQDFQLHQVQRGSIWTGRIGQTIVLFEAGWTRAHIIRAERKWIYSKRGVYMFSPPVRKGLWLRKERIHSVFHTSDVHWLEKSSASANRIDFFPPSSPAVRLCAPCAAVTVWFEVCKSLGGKPLNVCVSLSPHTLLILRLSCLVFPTSCRLSLVLQSPASNEKIILFMQKVTAKWL